MSDVPQGQGWWMASDGKFYPPHLHPDNTATQAARQQSPAPGTTSHSIVCPNGHRVSADAQFCPTCGAERPGVARQQQHASHQRRSRVKPAFVVTIAVIVLVGAGVAAYSLTRSSPTTKSLARSSAVPLSTTTTTPLRTTTTTAAGGTTQGAVSFSWAVTPVSSGLSSTSGVDAGVACASATDCLGVSGEAATSVEKLVAGAWVGGTPLVSTHFISSGIWCVLAECAVAAASSQSEYLFVTGNGGSTWASWPLPQVLNGGTYSILGAQCVSGTTCIVLGNGSQTPTTGTGGISPVSVEEVTTNGGKSWSSGSGLDPSLDSTSLTCSSAERCLITGSTSSGSQPEIEYSTDGGTTWESSEEDLETSVGDVNPHEAVGGISCPTTMNCYAIGPPLNSQGNASPFMFSSSDGGQSWTIANAPTPSGFFSAISCPSVSECVVGGSSQSPTPTGELFVTDTSGKSWTFEQIAKPPTSGFTSVDCPSDTTCVATGAGVEPLLGTGAAASPAITALSSEVQQSIQSGAGNNGVAIGDAVATCGPPNLTLVEGQTVACSIQSNSDGNAIAFVRISALAPLQASVIAVGQWDGCSSFTGEERAAYLADGLTC